MGSSDLTPIPSTNIQRSNSNYSPLETSLDLLNQLLTNKSCKLSNGLIFHSRPNIARVLQQKLTQISHTHIQTFAYFFNGDLHRDQTI